MSLLRHCLILLTLGLGASLPAQAAPEKVALQLKWRHQFQFAGYYMAQEKGYYRDAGLQVDIREGKAETSPVDEVVAGRADYGIGASELVLERAQGKPVVALATLMQHSPLVLLTRAGGGIRTVRDLEGGKLMLLPAEAELFAFLRRQGVTLDRVHLVPHSFSPSDLISGRVDALSAYASDETYDLERAGFPYLAFSPRTAGIDFYGDTLFTSEQELARHPERVAAFRAASLQGWRYALAHPEETALVILEKYSQRHTREHLLFEAERLQPLIQNDLVELGNMAPSRWQRIAATYRELGMLPASTDPALDGFLYTPPVPNHLSPWTLAAIVASLALALAAGLAAAHIGRLHQRLRAQMAEREHAAAILRSSQERLRIIFDTAPLAALVYDRNCRVLEWNHRAEALFGWKREEILGRSFFDYMIPEEAREHVAKIASTIFDGPSPQYSLNANRSKDGRTILCEWSNAVFADESTGQRCVVALAADVTEKQKIQAALQESEERYRNLLESAPFPVVVTRISDGTVIYINQRAAERFLVPQEQAPGRLAPNFWEDPEQRSQLIARLQQDKSVTDVEVQLRDGKGQPFWAILSARLLQSGGETVAFVSFNDISARKQAEQALQAVNRQLATQLQEIHILQERLREQAIRDVLTGLFNRRYLDETLDRELARAQRDGYPLALAMLDLDRFKQLNDTHGHRAGDEVLRMLGEFIREHARTSDIPCRYGGEEFLLVLPKMTPEAALQRADAWRQQFAARTVHFGELELHATLSIGIACYPGDGTTAYGLVDAADAALYRAKEAGRNQVMLAGGSATQPALPILPT